MTCCDASTGHTTPKGLASPCCINTVVLPRSHTVFSATALS